MRKILITGENGYISKSLKRYLEKDKSSYSVDLRSVRKENLNSMSLDGIDVLIHPAAIVHKKESSLSAKNYFEVNTDLTVYLAEKAKAAGVKQFIFFSTMAVYGAVRGCIDEHSELNPTSLYAKSKLLAEQRLLELASKGFHIAIVRPPMVYGANCPGNYMLLSRLAKKTPIFPNIHNKRSMIYIDNLCEHILQIINNNELGIFHPQDKDYVITTSMVKSIVKVYNKSSYTSRLIGVFLKLIIGNTNIYQKVFGDLYYSPTLSEYRDNSYQKYDFQKAILLTEKGHYDEEIT